MQSGSVIGVCISKEQGTCKTDIGHGYLQKDVGLVGDAHAGGERPVSVLAIECINDAVAGKGITAKPGDFAENITLEGIDLKGVQPGTRLILGEAEVEITQIGKRLDASHTFSFHGMVLLVSEGCFCRVVRSGRVKVGDQALLMD